MAFDDENFITERNAGRLVQSEVSLKTNKQ
jgi:hypothetical protein